MIRHAEGLGPFGNSPGGVSCTLALFKSALASGTSEEEVGFLKLFSDDLTKLRTLMAIDYRLFRSRITISALKSS